MRLSAVLIAKDEERDLPGCLESLKGLADEVVVVDGGSGDRTRELAREAGAVLLERVFDGYAPQKQAALERASGDWVLSIDADERVTPELAASIRAALALEGGPLGYEVPFEIRFLGRRLRWGGLGSERHLRLFKRGSGRFAGEGVHEGVAVSGEIGLLAGTMVHEPYRDLSEYLEKLDRYTSQAAAARFAAGRRASPLHHLLPFWELFVRLILRGGLLDGRAGLVWWGLSAFHTWLKFVKLRELQR